MSAGAVAGLIAAGAFLILALFGCYAIAKLARIFDEVAERVRQTDRAIDESTDRIRQAGTTVDEVNTALASVNIELAKVEQITTHVESITGNVSALTRSSWSSRPWWWRPSGWSSSAGSRPSWPRRRRRRCSTSRRPSPSSATSCPTRRPRSSPTTTCGPSSPGTSTTWSPAVSPPTSGEAIEASRSGSGPLVAEDDEGVAYVIGRAAESELEVTDVQVVQVLEAEMAYLDAIGALGTEVAPPRTPDADGPTRRRDRADVRRPADAVMGRRDRDSQRSRESGPGGVRATTLAGPKKGGGPTEESQFSWDLGGGWPLVGELDGWQTCQHPRRSGRELVPPGIQHAGSVPSSGSYEGGGPPGSPPSSRPGAERSSRAGFDPARASGP